MVEFNIDNYLRISWQDVLLVCISTTIIVLVCKKFFWDKLLKFVDQRQKLIQDNIDASVKIRQQADDLKEEYHEKLANIGAEANDIISSAKKQASLERTEIINAAKQQAAHMEQSALEEIEKEKLRAQNEMQDAIADVAIAAASSILASEIDEEKQRQIVNDFISKAGQSYEA